MASSLPPLAPQPGPQTAFLSSPADIAIYGGAAGGGKTWALLMEPLRHLDNPAFGAVIFRRTTVQVRNEGGLWDESERLYPGLGGDGSRSSLEWRFPSGAAVRFAHLEYDKTVHDWQGAQIALIGFDELTHFSGKQFWHLLSRNRSTCGIRPYVRATCNPDADSWVAEFVSWWLDPETGLPDPERAGRLRWFVRDGARLVWADEAGELAGRYPHLPPKSATFIPAKLSDNAALTAADPGYLANLLSLPPVERARLLEGNWKVRPAAGLLFRRHWCALVDSAPEGLRRVRGWDLAGTPKTEANDPDFTAGVLLGRSGEGITYVLDHLALRDTPGEVERLIRFTAEADGTGVEVALPQDPGQAGKAQALALTRALDGYAVRATPESGDKVTRFRPFSAAAEAGRVRVVRGAWNEGWFASLEAFPDARHDDDADATSRAFNSFLAVRLKGQGFLDLIRQQNPTPSKGEGQGWR
jgi:predicted phage terminase large subunit-like protein